jgi:hypothetical protein
MKSNFSPLSLHLITQKAYRRVQHCISELESLAIAPNRLNELNDAYEMEDLVDNIKLALYKEYKSDDHHQQ